MPRARPRRDFSPVYWPGLFRLNAAPRRDLIEILELDYESCASLAAKMIAEVERILDLHHHYERIIDQRPLPAHLRAELDELARLTRTLLLVLRPERRSVPPQALRGAKALASALSDLSHTAYKTLTAPMPSGTPPQISPDALVDRLSLFVARSMRPDLGLDNDDETLITALRYFIIFAEAWHSAVATLESRGRPERATFHDTARLLASVFDKYYAPIEDPGRPRPTRPRPTSPLRAEFVRIACAAAGIAMPNRRDELLRLLASQTPKN